MNSSALPPQALADHPQLGRPGQISGTRELIPHESYRLVYEIEGETVWVAMARVATAAVATEPSRFL
jgi:plasmid stabilization system protein ParE